MKSLLIAFSILASTFSAYAANLGDPTPGYIFPKAGVQAFLFWEVPPAISGDSVFRVEFYDLATNAAVNPAGAFTVDLWMPAMGHGSAPTKVESVKDTDGNATTGVYRVSNIHFLMPGKWDVRLNLTSVDGTKEMNVISLDLSSDDDPTLH